MSKHIENLGTLMKNQMQATNEAMAVRFLELGTISSNMALLPDNFTAPIPKGSYMVDIRLTEGLDTSETEHTHSGGSHAQYEGDGVHSHAGGMHKHTIPRKLRGIKSGDRVLIAWCGNEAVVVAIVESS